MDRPLSRFVRRLKRRSVLSDDEQSALLAIDPPIITATARTDLVRPGKTVDFACLVLEGMACRFERFGDGSRRTTAIHIPGDMCDLHSVPQPRAGWGITALSASTIAEVSHSDLRAVAQRFPNVARAFWRDTVADASILSKWLSTVTHLPGEKRLAHFLSEMSRRFEIAGLSDIAQEIGISQEQLADALGLSSVHINRIIRALRATGALEQRRLKIHILDRAKLESIAEYDETYLLLDNPT